MNSLIPFICLGVGTAISWRGLPDTVLKVFDWIINIALVILMLVIGLNIGTSPEVMNNLGGIGVSCVILSVAAILTSALFVSVLEKTVLPLEETRKRFAFAANLFCDMIGINNAQEDVEMKIAATDFDGTLCPIGEPIPEENIRAIKAWQAAGNKFGIATGRGLSLIRSTQLSSCGSPSHNPGPVHASFRFPSGSPFPLSACTECCSPPALEWPARPGRRNPLPPPASLSDTSGRTRRRARGANS